MEIEGRLIMDLPEVGGTSKTGNPWRKKEWVLETLGSYPRKICFNAFGDRIGQFNLEVGKMYKLGVDVESREYNGRWFTEVRVFSAQEMTGTAPAQAPQAPAGGYAAPQAAAPAAPQAPADPFGDSSNNTDDLPF